MTTEFAIEYLKIAEDLLRAGGQKIYAQQLKEMINELKKIYEIKH